MISFRCPHCKARLEIHARQAGNRTHCPDCGGAFKVPLPEAGKGKVRSFGCLAFLLFLVLLCSGVMGIGWLKNAATSAIPTEPTRSAR